MKFDQEKFRRDIISKRVIELDLSMDEASQQIGISKATISRIENKKTIDIDTFALCCTWLGVGTQNYFISTPIKRDFEPPKPPPQRFG
jgi:transcriptional regulator with XRE-family HTH domain